MVQSSIIIDCTTAQKLLQELLSHLPAEWWRLLHQKDAEDLGLTKALGCSRADIKALFANADIAKEDGRRFSINTTTWELFCLSKLSDPFWYGSKGRTQYVENGAPLHRTPSIQIKIKGLVFQLRSTTRKSSQLDQKAGRTL